VVPQQSESTAQVPPLSAQPHIPPAQVPVQQSLPAVQVSPSCAPEVPPQVLSQVPHVEPQQSLSAWQVAPAPQGGPQTPLVHTKASALQQSASVAQVDPWTPHAGAPQVPLVHRKVPQQSLSCAQAAPLSAQPQVPSDPQMLGAQQSLLAVQVAPEAWQPQVMLVVSQVSAPQQSVSAAQVWPLEAQVPPSPPPLPARQVLLVASQVNPVQHAGAVGSQSPSCPAHAAWHLPLAQLLEQQSPLVLQQSSSLWQFGSEVVQVPPLLELLEVLVWPLLELLEVLVWPLLELVLELLLAGPHLPAEQESEQHWA